jgi:cardiolipin synthase A/B
MIWSRFLTSESTWDAMLRDIGEARVSIDLETYILRPDNVGTHFIELLKVKAREGVRVRLLVDSVGSYTFFRSSVPEALRAAGVEVQFFNPIQAWRIHTFSSWFFRDHRKILVIDSSIGYTGGVGLQEGMRDWRDTHVRVLGAVVNDMKRAFEVLWTGMQTMRHPKILQPIRREGEDEFLESAPIFRRGRPAPGGPRAMRQNFIYRRLLSMMARAHSYIYLTTPYFVPPLRFFSAFHAAARRKVDVRLLVPYTSDHYWIDVASHSYFGTALRAGVRIFRYHKSIIHAKTAVIDGAWASVGSANLDNMSSFLNYEGNLVTTDGGFAKTLAEDFLADCTGAEEVRRADWKHRPVKNKVAELMTWPLHGFF